MAYGDKSPSAGVAGLLRELVASLAPPLPLFKSAALGDIALAGKSTPLAVSGDGATGGALPVLPHHAPANHGRFALMVRVENHAWPRLLKRPPPFARSLA